jgi:hypothetical protein
MLHHVALVRTDVSEDYSASIISNRRTLRRNALILFLTRQEPRGVISQKTAFPHSHSRENLKSYIIPSLFSKLRKDSILYTNAVLKITKTKGGHFQNIKFWTPDILSVVSVLILSGISNKVLIVIIVQGQGLLIMMSRYKKDSNLRRYAEVIFLSLTCFCLRARLPVNEVPLFVNTRV